MKPLNYIYAKLKYFISSDLSLWFPLLIIFIFLKYDILIQSHLLLFLLFLRELFWFGQLAFGWPQGEIMKLSWFDWILKPNPSVVQVCLFSRCSFVQLHVHHLFAAIILFSKESFQNTILSNLRDGNEAQCKERVRAITVCRKTISVFQRILMFHSESDWLEPKLQKFSGQESSTLATGGLQIWEMQYFGRLPVWLLMSQAHNLVGSHVDLDCFCASRVLYPLSIDPYIIYHRQTAASFLHFLRAIGLMYHKALFSIPTLISVSDPLSGYKPNIEISYSER